MNFFSENVGIVSIVWIGIFAIVFVAIFFSHRERTRRYRLIEMLAEKGQPIPPEMLSGAVEGSGYRHGNAIGSGVFMMCIGIALAVFFWALSGGGSFISAGGVPNWLPVIGIFPFMTGLARIIGYLFERPRAK
jgi:hypothetical protein